MQLKEKGRRLKGKGQRHLSVLQLTAKAEVKGERDRLSFDKSLQMG